MVIYLLYGLAKGETERYMETLLIASHIKSNIKNVKVIAKRDGFHSFRVAQHVDGKLPDFTKSVNKIT